MSIAPRPERWLNIQCLACKGVGNIPKGVLGIREVCPVCKGTGRMEIPEVMR